MCSLKSDDLCLQVLEKSFSSGIGEKDKMVNMGVTTSLDIDVVYMSFFFASAFNEVRHILQCLSSSASVSHSTWPRGKQKLPFSIQCPRVAGNNITGMNTPYCLGFFASPSLAFGFIGYHTEFTFEKDASDMCVLGFGLYCKSLRLMCCYFPYVSLCII